MSQKTPPCNLIDIENLTVLQFCPLEEVLENFSPAVQFYKEQIHAAPTVQPGCKDCDSSS